MNAFFGAEEVRDLGSLLAKSGGLDEKVVDEIENLLFSEELRSLAGGIKDSDDQLPSKPQRL